MSNLAVPTSAVARTGGSVASRIDAVCDRFEAVYDVVPREQLEANKRTIIQERLAKLSELDAAVAQTRVMRANTFDIMPVQ